MRVIFEESELQLFFEIILSPDDISRFAEFSGIVGEYAIDYQGIKTINVFIRKEGELCRSLKERKLKLVRGFKRILNAKSRKINEKCVLSEPKNDK